MSNNERKQGAESSIRIALKREGWDVDDDRVSELVEKLAAALARRQPELAQDKEKFIRGD